MSSSPVNSFPLSERKIAVILLAAGRGTRMGGDTPKLILPMKDGRPLLAHALENALSLRPFELVVVTRPDLMELVQSAKFKAQRPEGAVRFVANPRFHEGMGTSLAVGVGALSPEVEACLVMLGDEPFVPPQIVERLAQAFLAERRSITIPVYGEQPGPPTLFARDLFPELAVLEGDTGGRQLLARFPDNVARVRFHEQERPKDIDTPEDYLDLR
jgi:molybdenum cofactor cytidylyltransferase